MSEELKSKKPDSNEIVVDYDENFSEPGVTLGLQLGDIIRIKDPQNKILNNQTFYIDYIDPTKMKLINIDTLIKTELRIQPDKKIGDGTINEIVYAVAHSPYPNIEIIIVDDCSNDGTREKLKSQIAQLPEVSRVLYHDKNMGKGAALRTGFAAATGDILIVQDADLEYDPIQYPLIIEPILQGKDPKQQYRPRLTVRRTLIVLP